jgi:hypothetical protein
MYCSASVTTIKTIKERTNRQLQPVLWTPQDIQGLKNTEEMHSLTILIGAWSAVLKRELFQLAENSFK